MFYQVKPGTATEEKLKQLMAEVQSAWNVINTFCKKVNAKREVLCPPACFKGVSFLSFEETPDKKDWKLRKVPFTGEWYVPAAKSQYREEFNNLPRVRYQQLSELLDYSLQVGPNMQLSTYPGFRNNNDSFFISIPEWSNWKPSDDWTELTRSEYNLRSEVK